MSEDDILELARISADAYLYYLFSNESSEGEIKVFLYKFARAIEAKAVAKEREACAKVCENDESGRDSNYYFAEAIRARGE